MNICQTFSQWAPIWDHFVHFGWWRAKTLRRELKCGICSLVYHLTLFFYHHCSDCLAASFQVELVTVKSNDIVSIPSHKILNRINGDTKDYKERVKRESDEKCINQLKSEYASAIFDAVSISDNHKEEFFQFCLEDNQFSSICEHENQIQKVSFLLEKLKIFKIQLNEDN